MHVLAVTLVLLHGVVMRGPTQPVCELGTPCSAPAPHVLLDFHRTGVDVRTRTDAHGNYAVRLRPGRYVVRVARVRPTTLSVPMRRRLRADFNIDTGIR